MLKSTTENIHSPLAWSSLIPLPGSSGLPPFPPLESLLLGPSTTALSGTTFSFAAAKSCWLPLGAAQRAHKNDDLVHNNHFVLLVWVILLSEYGSKMGSKAIVYRLSSTKVRRHFHFNQSSTHPINYFLNASYPYLLVLYDIDSSRKNKLPPYFGETPRVSTSIWRLAVVVDH